jgi:hypothetical protein
VSTSNPAIQVRIGPRVSAAYLAVLTAVFVVGLLVGVLIGDGGLRRPTTAGSPGPRIVHVRGPQGHVDDMIDLRTSIVGHRFPVPLPAAGPNRS